MNHVSKRCECPVCQVPLDVTRLREMGNALGVASERVWEEVTAFCDPSSLWADVVVCYRDASQMLHATAHHTEMGNGDDARQAFQSAQLAADLAVRYEATLTEAIYRATSHL